MHIRPGDIIFIHVNSWSNFLTMLRLRVWWTHSAMMGDNGKTIEMTDKNVRFLTFKKRYAAKKIMIITFKNLSYKDRKKLVQTALEMYDKKFDRLRLLIPGLPQLRKNRFVCTTFIDTVYQIALGKKINVTKMMRLNKKYLKEIDATIVYDYRKNK